MSLEDFSINDAPYNLGSMPWPENRMALKGWLTEELKRLVSTLHNSTYDASTYDEFMSRASSEIYPKTHAYCLDRDKIPEEFKEFRTDEWWIKRGL